MSILLIISINSAYHDAELIVNDKRIFVELINERISRFGIRSSLLWFFPRGNSIKCFLGTCLHASNGSKLSFPLVLCPLICVRNMILFVQGLLWDGGTEFQDEPGARVEFLCSRWTRNYQWRREAKPIRLKKKKRFFVLKYLQLKLIYNVGLITAKWFTSIYIHTHMCICRYIYVCACVCVYVYMFFYRFFPLTDYKILLLQNSIVPYAIQ